MFWICAENNVDNAERFLLLLSSVYTESRCFFAAHPALQIGR